MRAESCRLEHAPGRVSRCPNAVAFALTTLRAWQQERQLQFKNKILQSKADWIG
jgi:hypothetical protein